MKNNIGKNLITIISTISIITFFTIIFVFILDLFTQFTGILSSNLDYAILHYEKSSEIFIKFLVLCFFDYLKPALLFSIIISILFYSFGLVITLIITLLERLLGFKLGCKLFENGSLRTK